MHTYLACLLLFAACSSEGTAAPDVDAGTEASDGARADARPMTDAAVTTVCASKDPVVQLIYTCDFQWKQCSGTSTADHEIDCKIQAAGSLRFSLCDCKVSGASQMQFTSTSICGLGSWPDVEAEANMRCGWNLH